MFTPITMVLQLMNSLFYFLENARGASFPMACTSAVINSFQFTPLQEGLRDYNIRLWRAGYISIHAPARGASAKNTNFLSVFCCFLFIKYIFTKLILSNPQFNQYRPYFCAIFIAPISWDFMYGKYMRKIL